MFLVIKWRYQQEGEKFTHLYEGLKIASCKRASLKIHHVFAKKKVWYFSNTPCCLIKIHFYTNTQCISSCTVRRHLKLSYRFYDILLHHHVFKFFRYLITWDIYHIIWECPEKHKISGYWLYQMSSDTFTFFMKNCTLVLITFKWLSCLLASSTVICQVVCSSEVLFWKNRITSESCCHSTSFSALVKCTLV